MPGEDDFLSETDRARVSGFNLPVYFSRGTALEFIGLSTQSHNGRIEVVEVAYVTPPRAAPDCEQPSVWTWRNVGLDAARSLRIHASTHLVNHRADFREGAWIPTTSDMDDLGDSIDAGPRKPTLVDVCAEPVGGWRSTNEGWEFTAIELEDVLVTMAGRAGFAEAGVIPRLVGGGS